jgi:hypothetical protein
MSDKAEALVDVQLVSAEGCLVTSVLGCDCTSAEFRQAHHEIAQAVGPRFVTATRSPTR